MNERITTLTDATFDDGLALGRPTLVDFWAEGCEPCRAMMPILEEIANEHRASLAIGSVHLDDAPQLAQRFEIMALPTLIVFVDGRAEKRLIGASSKAELLAQLQEFLTSRPAAAAEQA